MLEENGEDKIASKKLLGENRTHKKANWIWCVTKRNLILYDAILKEKEEEREEFSSFMIGKTEEDIAN